MKSRISIDFDFDNNNPIIKIDYIHSDDLRDKHVKMFLEKFGSVSSWAQMRFLQDSPYGGTSRTAVLSPITHEGLIGHAALMKEVVEKNPYSSHPQTES